ncbi:MAG: Gfo/Idh/MocA family oxidoreductase [Pirellulales bacterium]|nr:Gfo/Idh/MocA family oxidoreductase [Pirellulales bacterium]
MSRLDRRSFVQMAGGTMAASSLFAQTARADVNSKIRAAVLGVNGRGRIHMQALEGLSGVEVAVLCDPDELILAQRAKEFEESYDHSVEIETDLRRVYDRDDIDVVAVATPNHWHALATIWACQAGKDVYVEKPGTHNLFEGRKMIEAAKKYNRVVQHGVQLRSSPALQEAVAHMRDGLIGDVYMARGLVYRWRPSIGKRPDTQAPGTLNWDLWQGPAPERKFSERLVHYDWHWHWNYGNGDVGNQGVHETDMCLWGLGVELPSKITAMGGKFLWDDDKQTPELLSSSYYYPEENKMIEFEVRPWCTNLENGMGVGNIFYGSKGYLVVHSYNRYESFLGSKRKPGPKGASGDPVPVHFQNFIDVVRSRDVSQLRGPVETAHTSSGLAHLGNIAYRLGRQLEFDPQTEKFVNDPEADAMLTREYRAPYVVPDVV